jgi:hypothetical protein
MTDIDKTIEEAKAGMLPYESWERLAREGSSAFAAFCAFRDCGPERNIRKAVGSAEKDEVKREKRYKVWRNWCSKFRWRERAADYDRYIGRLKQGEMRKTQRKKFTTATEPKVGHRVTRSFKENPYFSSCYCC